ncbi:uncharacterized protein BXIN_2498 [Babesia sp. Xinjiang]|uniref:uncharacterized protein n=1 Tax=Babesia sp. Xinjiang TaxID=462227 RepID=UPI000A224F8D|nr:uncharacterized protein BXIN_2498 [Babesia sp. Xinjiang]ORM41390.1 hypothetical protein BXIN_2498 [Babesia sp. Xinjiang]
MVGIYTLSISATVAILCTRFVAAISHDGYGYNNASHNRNSTNGRPGAQVLPPAPTPRTDVTGNTAVKDYVIVLQNVGQFDRDTKEELGVFVKELVKSLAATSGRNRLSLMDFSSTTTKWLSRKMINKDAFRRVAMQIDKMFKKRSRGTEADLGSALKFMRESVYPNGSKYLVNDKTTELPFENAAGKDTVVFIITNASVGGRELALEEAFDANRNGVTFFVVDIGSKAEKFWARFLGCRYHYFCPNYLSIKKLNPANNVDHLMKLLGSNYKRDAFCLEEWSDYSECSKPCGAGIKTSVLKGFKTLLTQSTSPGAVGRTCEEQLRNVKPKQLLCNMQSCSSLPNLVTVNRRSTRRVQGGENPAVSHSRNTSLVEENSEYIDQEGYADEGREETEDEEGGEENNDEVQVDDDDDDDGPRVSRDLDHVKVESDWYKPGAQPDRVGDLPSDSYEDIKRERKTPEDLVVPRVSIPRLYDGDKGLDRMLQYAADANHYISKCSTEGKDYVIAVEETTGLDDHTWQDLHAFVKLLAHALSVTSETNTLSLVNIAATTDALLNKTPLKWRTIRRVALEIDAMFENRKKDTEANLGNALKFMRESVYPNGSKYLVNNYSEITYENAVGKDTVVFLITHGNLGGRESALKEAFDARRNGVTFFVVDLKHKWQNYWAEILGCNRHYTCPNYMPNYGWNVMNNIKPIMKRLCTQHARDAVCYEEWSDFSECSRPCGAGIRTATLKSHRTLISAGSSHGAVGRTCEEQLRGIKTKQVFCNMHSCTQRTHKPENDGSGGSPAQSTTKGETPDTTSDVSSVKAAGGEAEVEVSEPKDEIDNESSGDGNRPAGGVRHIYNPRGDSPEIYDTDDGESVDVPAEGDLGTNEQLSDDVSGEKEPEPLSPQPPQDIAGDVENAPQPGSVSPLGPELTQPEVVTPLVDNEDIQLPGSNVVTPEVVPKPAPVGPKRWEDRGHSTREDGESPHSRRKEGRDENTETPVKNTTKILVGSALCVILIALVGVYKVSRKRSTPANIEDSDEGNFLDGRSGGKDEVGDTYRVADASDNVWA